MDQQHQHSGLRAAGESQEGPRPAATTTTRSSGSAMTATGKKRRFTPNTGFSMSPQNRFATPSATSISSTVAHGTAQVKISPQAQQHDVLAPGPYHTPSDHASITPNPMSAAASAWKHQRGGIGRQNVPRNDERNIRGMHINATTMMSDSGAQQEQQQEQPPILASDLRALVQDCIDKHNFSSAIFFADKLATLSNNDPTDVFLLARCFFLDRQYLRAVHLMRKREMLPLEGIEEDPLPVDQIMGLTEVGGGAGLHRAASMEKAMSRLQFQYLAGQCLAACNQWEDCLAVLGEAEAVAMARLNLADAQQRADDTQKQNSNVSRINLSSAVCLLRGKAYEALENRQRAVLWFQEALRRDVKCFEALEYLIERRLLSQSAEKALFAELHFPPELKWLRCFYESKLGLHDQAAQKIVVAHFDQLEQRYGLKDNLDLLSAVAEHHYYRNDFRACYKMSKAIVEQDPYNHAVLPVYLCTLVELKKHSELFYCAHQLVEAYAEKTVSWYGVGCYYYAIGKYDVARRYFAKCTKIDGHFAPGWVAFGHSFAVQEESDQAMAAYRTAARLFEGLHLPLLCIGMEYIRTNNLTLARQFIVQSHNVCPTDPLALNELGVILYRQGSFASAVDHLLRALSLAAKESLESWEATLFNLGHAYRKLGQYALAINYYKKALRIAPRSPSVDSAIGFTYHLAGDLDNAIQYYHKALGMRPRDTFTSDMLSHAMEECMLQGVLP